MQLKYWWVSQNSTFKHESQGGYMWSPKVNKNGSPSPYYDNMRRVQPGDIIFSFESGLISAIGIASSKAYSEVKPGEFGKAGDVWLDEGWKVDVDYHFLNHRIRPSEHMDVLLPLLPSKYSPLQASGRGNQAYLFAVPENMATGLAELIGQEYSDFVLLGAAGTAISAQESEMEEAIRNSKTIPTTEKVQLVKSRRGQGIFRTNLEIQEACCRVTLITERKHLIASHIKPWRVSDNNERLDGNNGLLLAPHIDHLFDRGYISFEDDGTMLISPSLGTSVLEAWGIQNRKFAPFNDQQAKYMAFHREYVFAK